MNEKIEDIKEEIKEIVRFQLIQRSYQKLELRLIADEKARAEYAEDVLRKDLALEIERSKEMDDFLSNSINEEALRASEEEKKLVRKQLKQLTIELLKCEIQLPNIDNQRKIS